MKINEITNVDFSEIKLSEIDRSNEEKISDIDGFPLMKIVETISNRTLHVYYLLDNDIIIAAVVTHVVTVNEVNYLQTIRIFIDEEYRGKDYGVVIYYKIKYNERMNLMSDREQTADGKALWDRLEKRFDVSVLDLETEEIVRDVDIDDIYADRNVNNSYVLVTESDMNYHPLLIPNLQLPRKN